MEKETVSRLRIYALIYRLEDELLRVRRREGESSQMALFRSMVVAYPTGYSSIYGKKYEEYMAARAKQEMERLNEAALLLNKGFEITAAAFDDLVDALHMGPRKVGNYGWPPIAPEKQYFEERGFTGYCGNRSKYGPRTPKRR